MSAATAAVLFLAACSASPPPSAAAGPAASIMPPPTERYTCERGTKLSVKLLGETAEVGVDGAADVSLPALGKDGTTLARSADAALKQGGSAIGRWQESCKPD
jgi:hypothetical protein